MAEVLETEADASIVPRSHLNANGSPPRISTIYAVWFGKPHASHTLHVSVFLRYLSQHVTTNQGRRKGKKYKSLFSSSLVPLKISFPLPILNMSTLLRFCLLLGALSTLVSSKTTPLLTPPAVYNNCSGNNPISLPTNTASTSYFKPQLRVKKNGIGWEEWVFLAHNRQADGSELVYSYKWALGDPTVGNVSQHAFTAWAYFPGGASYNQVVYGDFKYEEHSDGGFTYSIGKNSLTWDPVHDIWHTSVNAGGWIIETNTEKRVPSHFCLFFVTHLELSFVASNPASPTHPATNPYSGRSQMASSAGSTYLAAIRMDT